MCDLSVSFDSVFACSCGEASQMLRRWFLENDEFIMALVTISFFNTATFVVIGMANQWCAGKVMAVLWGVGGLVLCLVMLTVLLTGKRGGEV